MDNLNEEQIEESKENAQVKFEEIKAFKDLEKIEKDDKIINDIINGTYKGYKEYE